MPDQQMRYEQTLYPVDRYLVESSKQIDMINIIDDDIWNPEPALRPEDEIILRKLHDMLQSTADDLKLLSGELSKYHEPGVQKKTLPMPLDEEFNEKVHIEEVVNAKFLGHGLIDSVQVTPKIVQKDSIVNDVVQSIVSKRNTKDINIGKYQVPSARKTSLKKNLGISRIKILQILEDHSNDEKQTISKNIEEDFSVKKNKPSCVAYNEFCHIDEQPSKINISPKKSLQVQNMPSVNIRSQLREQKVLQLDIIPNSTDLQEIESVRNNALVIELKHEPVQKLKVPKPMTFDHIKIYPTAHLEKPVTRKISKMSVYESSESTINASSECQQHMHKVKLPSRVIHNTKKNIKNVVSKKERRSKSNLDEWKNKLNSVYGTKTTKTSGVKFKKPSPKRSSTTRIDSTKKSVKDLPNLNVEYIPYTQLTLGGVNVSDIEREISSIPNRNNIVLSPILDKILSSRENSFHKNSPVKNKKESPKILTTSDENLLQEVLNIEKQVTNTISEKKRTENKILKKDQSNKSDSSKASDSYVDDFEDDKSFECDYVQAKQSDSLNSISPKSDEAKNLNELNGEHNDTNIHNKTFIKVSNLSFKNKVDIFEFLPSIDIQDTGTQSSSSKIEPQETQTSPKNGNSIQSIRNDLWASIDPRGEVEKMFKLEKDFIKKLFIEEYGDLLEKNLNKPSTSKDAKIDIARNVTASQKNTQTSPAHVKSVMTSPKQTKTRTTSPFALSLNVNQQTSPLIIVSNEEQLKLEIEGDDDLGISVNLSSPRFSLRLPQSSREILSNVDGESIRHNSINKLDRNLRRYISSSSSVDGDYSSSDISSIGEIHKKYKRRLRKVRIPSLTELSSPSSLSRYTGTDHSDGILPLKSDGEASLGQLNRKNGNNVSKSEGEISLGQLK